jgi:ATP-dependent exoDNAse (exonuclease V) beta subunit
MSGKEKFPHLVIRASAGTGKTHQLATRFIGLLASGVRPDQILATTFTRKAAGEILDRVLFRLAAAAGEDAKRRELAGEIGRPLTRDECRQLLIQTVRQLHRLHIGTLDSFFIRVATNFGQELGLPPGWAIGDELVDAALRDEAIEQVLARGRSADLLALVHALTKGETQRSVSRLVRDTVAGLFEVFREAQPAAWEALPQPKGLKPEELEQTLEAIAAVELPPGQFFNTREKDLARARAADWEALISAGFAAKVLAGESVFNRKPLPQPLIEQYRKLLSHVESVLVGQVARQTKATQSLLAKFAEEYFALQVEQRALRFSDVTFRLAEETPAAVHQRLAFRLDGGLAHLLLDEFQDTSPSQWRVLAPLARQVTQTSGGSFFCVGDSKQAIYGWRGGEAGLFETLDDELTGLTPSDLSASFRSAQPVIDAVNQVFANLSKHPNLDKLQPPIEAWQQGFPHHTTTKTGLAGYVTLATSPEARDDEDPAAVALEFAAAEIQKTAAAAPQASVGVLVRTNEAVARMIYLLRDRGVPASEEGGNALVDSPAVELILSLLRVADHPGDTVARFHLAHSPLAKVLDLQDHQHNGAAARLSQDVRRQLMDAGYGAAVFAWARRLAASCDARDQSRLQQLVELAYDYQLRSTLRTSDFIRLVEKTRIADPRAAGVRVMTIHQAKGLQFDAVFLPELTAWLAGQREIFVAGRPKPAEAFHLVCRAANEHVRRFFPQPLQELFDADTRREVTESLCVLYVAMTRAVHALHMILPPARKNEQSLPKTLGGLLRAALAEGQPAAPSKVLYEHGDPNWHRTLPKNKERSLPKDDGTRSVPATIKLAPPEARRQRGLERTSPSSLEGGTLQSAALVLNPRSAAALNTGTLIHAWLEQVEWLDDGLPSDAILRQIAERLRPEIGDVSAQLEGLIARFRQQLAAPAVAAVMRRSCYTAQAGDEPAQAIRERKFALRTGDELLSGSIDRLVILRKQGQIRAAEVLDFKTDDVAQSDASAIADKTEFYAPQLAAYAAAASRLLNLSSEQITTRLVFLSAGVVKQL